MHTSQVGYQLEEKDELWSKFDEVVESDHSGKRRLMEVA